MKPAKIPKTTGTRRLFVQFLLMLIPIFGLTSAIGLHYLSEHQTRMAKDELAAKIGALGAAMVAILDDEHHHSTAHINEILGVLIATASVDCVELVASDGRVVTATPVTNGCGLLARDEVLTLPLKNTKQHLNISFNLHEIENVKRTNSRYAQLILSAGLLLAAAASYLGFRLIVGRPLRALLGAIQHTASTGQHNDVATNGRTELSAIIDAYNALQQKVLFDTEEVRRRKNQLEAEIERRMEAENEAVAARNIAEQAAMQAREAAQSAELANRAKSAFLAMISHELRTPLNSVIGFSHLLQRSVLDTKSRDYLNHINTSSEALLAIINDLLDLSRIEAGKLELEPDECDVRTIVDNCIALLQSKAEDKGLLLRSQISPQVPQLVFADPKRLRQILINLVSNSIKFTSRGGACIVLGYAARSEHEGQLRIEVSDTGIGIAPEHQERIFDRFLQVETNVTRAYEGTGLGLAICRELVSMMGGTISLTSELGTGTTFRVDIPVHLPCRMEQPAHRLELRAHG